MQQAAAPLRRYFILPPLFFLRYTSYFITPPLVMPALRSFATVDLETQFIY